MSELKKINKCGAYRLLLFGPGTNRVFPDKTFAMAAAAEYCGTDKHIQPVPEQETYLFQAPDGTIVAMVQQDWEFDYSDVNQFNIKLTLELTVKKVALEPGGEEEIGKLDWDDVIDAFAMAMADVFEEGNEIQNQILAGTDICIEGHNCTVREWEYV